MYGLEWGIVKLDDRIRTGAVVGAGSVVTKDIQLYEIWTVNPTKKICSRFDDSCLFLEKIELSKINSIRQIVDIK